MRSSRPRPAVWCSATSTRAVRRRLRRRAGRRWSTRSRRRPRPAAQRVVQRRAAARSASIGARSTRPRVRRDRSPRAAAAAASGLGSRPWPAEPDDAAPTPDRDPHTTAGKLADLERRYDEAVHAGSARAVEKQHAKGKKTARERIEALLDEGSLHRARRARPAPLDQLRHGRRTGRTATAWSPATAPSTAARSACSARTSRSSAARSARCTARRSSRCWTSR